MQNRSSSDANIDVPDLGGLFSVSTHAKPVQGRSDTRVEHIHKYRSITGARLNVKIVSALSEEDQYVSVPASDSLSPNKRKWTHSYQTKTRDMRTHTAIGYIVPSVGGRAGVATIDVHVSGDKPFSIPCISNSIDFPLN